MANYIILAASSSMGQATVKQLINQGHKVFTTARNNNRISADANLDLTDFLAVEDVFKTAQAKLGEIHGVACFAGSLLLKPAHLTSYDQYLEIVHSSLTASFACVRAAASVLRKAGGSVVLLSSAVANIGMSNHEAIAAAKAGVEGLMRSAATTYAEHNIRFNAVAPGLTATQLTEKIVSNDAATKYSLNFLGLRRLGTVEDIANAVCFFLNPANDWITGQVLAVDGGLSKLKRPT